MPWPLYLAAARLAGRGRTGLALAHGYDTAFWWTAGIFAAGAAIGGVLLRHGPLDPQQAAQSRQTARSPRHKPRRARNRPSDQGIDACTIIVATTFASCTCLPAQRVSSKRPSRQSATLASSLSKLVRVRTARTFARASACFKPSPFFSAGRVATARYSRMICPLAYSVVPGRPSC